MSRSYRKTPIWAWTCAISDKPFKKAEHRRFRRREHIAEIVYFEEDTNLNRFPYPKEYGDPWNSPKDGKTWHNPIKDYWMCYWVRYLDPDRLAEYQKRYEEHFRKCMRK